MVIAQCFCSPTVLSSRRLSIRACTDSPAAFEASPPAPVSVSVPSSLVSKTPLLDSLEGTAGIVKVNHYSVLGVASGASTSQIAQAFKDRCEEVMQRQNGEESTSELRALQESFEILTTTEERRVYDWALERYKNPEGSYIWPYETDITQKYNSKEPVPVMRTIDEEGNNRVGLFFLAWVLLSIPLSTLMKTWLPYDFNP